MFEEGTFVDVKNRITDMPFIHGIPVVISEYGFEDCVVIVNRKTGIGKIIDYEELLKAKDNKISELQKAIEVLEKEGK
jgi:hypothetical protein